jgi:glycosyltransferase involved in cell wall biosynthesis
MIITHGPCNVGNQAQGLSDAEKNIGLKSRAAVNYQTWLGYNSDFVISEYQSKSTYSGLKRLFFAIYFVFTSKCMHYYFGRSFLCWDDFGPFNKWWFLDLRAAKLLGARVFMTLQGCDARLAYKSNKINEITPCDSHECKFYEGCLTKVDNDRLRLIEQIIPNCHKVFALNPELIRFVPKAEFLPYASVDPRNFKPAFPKTDGPIKIVHAPSESTNKGTEYVLEAVEQLKKDLPIEFELVQNLPHEEALKKYASADVLIDQFLFGWYGGVAVEAMAMGKPVVCYLRESDFINVPISFMNDVPIIRASKNNLYAVLKEKLSEREKLSELGKLSRSFVEKWHDPIKIADAMAELYSDKSNKLSFWQVYGTK